MLDNLGELVVKEVHGSGGYGMLIGPAATKATIEAFRDKLKREPEGFIAQPTLALSTCPTCTESGLAPAPRRFAAVRADRQRARHHRAGRPDAGGAEGRIAGGQFEPGRRHQRYVDPG